MICHSWKVMFHAEYSSGQPLKMLADLRTVVEEAIGRAGSQLAAGGSALAVDKKGIAKAAAATSGSSDSLAIAESPSGDPDQFESKAPEFDISAHSGLDEGDVLS